MKMVKNIGDLDVSTAIDIAPLIDCVFLLLIYFMVTSAVIKKEGDIGFMLPSSVSQAVPMNVPIETQIEIAADGAVQTEGLQFSGEDRTLNDLVGHLQGLRQVAGSQQVLLAVNLVPNSDTLHERIIEVMDACAAAGVTNLTFSKAM